MKTIAFIFIAMSLATAAGAQDKSLVAAARATLAKLQQPSFGANREYCGLIGIAPNGQIVATRARKGRVDSCRPRDFSSRVDVVASYHTHGAFDADVDAEVPSVDDILADQSEGIDGFISTPGGRLWFVDGKRGAAIQLCGLNCLPSDPEFRPRVYGPVATKYTLSELSIRESQ